MMAMAFEVKVKSYTKTFFGKHFNNFLFTFYIEKTLCFIPDIKKRMKSFQAVMIRNLFTVPGAVLGNTNFARTVSDIISFVQCDSQ